jgi:hypothetical protein
MNTTTTTMQEPTYHYHTVNDVICYCRTSFSSTKKLTAEEAIAQAEQLGDWHCDGEVQEESDKYFVECTNIATGKDEEMEPAKKQQASAVPLVADDESGSV